MDTVSTTTHDNSPDAPTNTPLGWVLLNLLHKPGRIIVLWNWKSASLSVLLRAPIFLIATIRRGFAVSAGAVLTECVFCALSAGFYGSLAQEVRDAQPEWLTIVFLAVIVPTFFQICEYLLHRMRGTPHLRIAEIASIGVAAISALFNLYAMHRGALLVGGEGSGFLSDLRQLPRLLFDFIVGLPHRLRSKRSA